VFEAVTKPGPRIHPRTIPTPEINDSRLSIIFISSGFHRALEGQDAECEDSGLRFSSLLLL